MMMKNKVEKVTKEEFDSVKSELNDKYVRLYAEFENYKKRTQKEKEDIKNFTKLETLAVILDVDNDLFIASNKVKNEGVNLILSKLDKFLKSQGIESIQNEKYDADVHEVISVVETGKEGIVEVVSKGYKLNGNVIRHPKVILSK
jgi:molecular chaperone GrpE